MQLDLPFFLCIIWGMSGSLPVASTLPIGGSVDRVSVVIPVHKVERFIEQCVQSVVEQTYPDVEIILVDDCGGDRSIELAEAVLKKSARPWQILYHEKNRGQSAARNTGTDVATGKYLYYVDSDDYIGKNAIAALVEAIKKFDAHIAYGKGRKMLMPDGSLKPIWKENADNLHEMDPFHAHLQEDTPLMPWHRLIDLDAYRKTGIRFKEGIVHEDDYWSFELSRTNLRICTAPGENLYFYRQHPDSVMAEDKGTERRLNGRLAVLRLHYRVMLDEKLYEDPIFRKRYAHLFHQIANIITVRKNYSYSQKRQLAENFINEFSYIIPEIRKTHIRLRRFVSWGRYIPACLAMKLASVM